MKIRRRLIELAIVVAVALPAVLGCPSQTNFSPVDGHVEDRDGRGAPDAPSQPTVAGYAYVVGYGGSPDFAGSVAQLTIASDGQLAAMPTASVPAGKSASALAISTRGVYAVNFDDDSVSQYAAGTDGALTALTPAAVDSGTGSDLPLDVVVAEDPNLTNDAARADARYLYALNGNSNDIKVYTVGATGALTALTTSEPDTVASAGRPGSGAVAVVVNDQCVASMYLYVGSITDHAIRQFAIGSDGGLTPLATASVAIDTQTPRAIAVSPDGKYLYAATTGSSDEVRQFAIGSDGQLSALSPATLALATSPDGLAIAPAGGYVFVTDSFNNALTMFKAGSDGKLAPLTTPSITTGSGPVQGAFDATGAFFYLPLAGAQQIAQFGVSDSGVTALSPATIAYTVNGPIELATRPATFPTPPTCTPAL